MELKKYLPISILLAISLWAVFMPALPTKIVSEGINSGDTAWMLAAAGLVLLMTPGLAYFYGGMVNSKNVISTMFQSFIAMGVISLLWVIIGFSLAFGDSIGGFIGNPMTFLMGKGILDGSPWSLAPTIPMVVFFMFQMKFAVIAPALVTGSFAERINFKSYVILMVLFSLFVYAPLAHWTWHPQGWLFSKNVLDFAGGTVVHMSAGWAALAGALFLKRRKAHVDANLLPPANIPFVLLGTGLLWFGWFGFNAGSALSAGALAGSAFAVTNTAAAAAGLAWVLFDTTRGKKVSSLGFCIGAVVGLVAITPAAGYVTIPVSIFIGTIAGITSNFFAHLKSKSTLDDTLDVFPCHGVGGMVGMVMTGIFATKAVNGAIVDEGLFTGSFTLFTNHIIALVAVSIFAFGMSWIVLKITDLIEPLRVSEQDEKEGLDISQHDEFLVEHR